MPAKKKPAKKMPKKKPAAAMGPVRLPAIAEDRLTAEQRSLMSAIASGPRGTFKMSGPFFCYLHAPAFGELAQKLGAYCRFGTSIAPRLTEFAILATAHMWKAHYEWAAHEPEALKEGVEPRVIEVIKHRKPTAGLDETDATVIELGRQIFRDHKVTPEIFAKAKALFGPNKLVELVMLMGNYASTAALLTAVDMQLHPGQKPLLPIP